MKIKTDAGHIVAESKLPQCMSCSKPSLPGRILCEECAFPAESNKSDRRRAVEAQKEKMKRNE